MNPLFPRDRVLFKPTVSRRRVPSSTVTIRPSLKKPEPEKKFPVEGVTYQLHEMPIPPKRMMGFKEWCEKVWDRREVLVDDPPAVK
jgi:hypothetical protein